MKTNYETATAFVNFESARGSHLTSAFNMLWSYSTPIARHNNGTILLTYRQYSNTTKRHKLHLKRAAAAEKNIFLFEVPNIEASTRENHEHNYKYLCNIAEHARNKANHARTEYTRNAYIETMVEAETTAASYYNCFLFV